MQEAFLVFNSLRLVLPDIFIVFKELLHELREIEPRAAWGGKFSTEPNL